MYGSIPRGANTMRRCALILAMLLAASGHRLAAQRVTTIRLIQAANGGGYRFVPARVRLQSGEVLEFTVTSGGPYVVAFEPADFPSRSRSLMAAALGGGSGELRGPVLLGAGSRFRLTVPPLPAGTYRFYSLLHVAYRMSGVLTVGP
jgi:plastocyanin